MIHAPKVSKIYYRVLFLLFIFKIVSSQNVPRVPCPQYFSYKQDGQRIIGGLELDPPQIGETFLVELEMSVGVRLPSEYIGQLELIGNDNDNFERVKRRMKLTYNVFFPHINQIPQVTQILVNGQQICFGPPVQAHVVTKLQLQHTLNTSVTKYQVNLNSVNEVPYYPPSRFDINSYGQQGIREPSYQPIHNMQPSVQQQFIQPQPQPPQTQRQPERQPARQPQPSNNNQFERTPSTTQKIECGVRSAIHESTPLVYGGADIERGSWPWLAAIYRRTILEQVFQCGGNLISPRAVVSSAHCFVKPNSKIPNDQILIELGRYDRQQFTEPGMIQIGVSQIIAHDDYRPNQGYDADIAVLILQRNVEYTEFIRPICLPNNQRNVVGLSGTVVGWGKTENNQVSPTPKKVEQPVVSESVCIQSNDNFKTFISSRTFCAGDRQGGGPCQGDSGGGFGMYLDGHWVLQGTVSASLAEDGGCNLRNYIIYCDVSKFTSWLRPFM